MSEPTELTDECVHDRFGQLDRSVCGSCDEPYIECTKCCTYACKCTWSDPSQLTDSEALAMTIMAHENVGRSDLASHPLEWHWENRFSDEDRDEYREMAAAIMAAGWALAAPTAAADERLAAVGVEVARWRSVVATLHAVEAANLSRVLDGITAALGDTTALADHDARVRAEALREAAEAWLLGGCDEVREGVKYLDAGQILTVDHWLRARANRERGAGA